MIQDDPRPLHSPLPAPPSPDPATLALFLDIDGCLLDFASRPDAVRVETQLREHLHRLRTALDGALAMLSGRHLDEIDALFDWGDGAAAGVHGAQLRHSDGSTADVDEDAAFATLHANAAALVSGLPGVLLEDKAHALALHYRNAPGARDAVEDAAHRLLQRAGRDYELQRGDHVIELKRAGTDKGSALAALMATPPFRGRQPWVLGDDLTDEDAFARVNALHGISVIVGARRPTCACYALADPVAVREWLAALTARVD